MSIASKRGRDFELKIARMMRAKADQAAKRDSRSGANWHRRSDIFTKLPLHIEAKDHETMKPKEWYRQAKGAAGSLETAVVVFHADEEMLCLLSFDDLLNLFIEAADLRLRIEKSLETTVVVVSQDAILASSSMAKRKAGLSGYYCKNLHIADEDGRCLAKNCPFARGYRVPKAKKK